MADLHPIFAENVFETCLIRTEDIRLLVFDLQHMSPENGLET